MPASTSQPNSSSRKSNTATKVVSRTISRKYDAVHSSHIDVFKIVTFFSHEVSWEHNFFFAVFFSGFVITKVDAFVPQILQEFFVIIILPDASSFFSAIQPVLIKIVMFGSKIIFLNPKIRHKLRKSIPICRFLVVPSHKAGYFFLFLRNRKIHHM